ncbi:MAG: hypothetical protein DRP56_08745 [Planctomycetota bacterium]|nr:MAG: hypothetical protein DRP56_08745 [Planctomycetota bacterium]
MAKQRVNVVVSAKDLASKKFRRIAGAAVGMVGAFMGFRALKSVVAGSLKAYGEQEQAETKLQQALIATGGAAGFSFEQLKKHAAALQKTTTYGDESIMVMQSLLATFRNVQGDVFTEATTLALDMSKAMGQDLKSSSIMLGKALNDPVTGLTALSRVGITFSEVQKEQIKQFQKTGDLAAAQGIIMAELSNQFGGQATAAAGTFSGALKQLGNSWGDAMEKMGEYIANIPGFASGIQFAKTVIENFGVAMDIVWTQAALGMVSFWEDIKHFFGSTIPAVLQWFAGNWKDIFMTIWNGTKSIFANMFTNIKEFFGAVWSWMKGDGFDFTWTSLLDGFESTLKEMPNIVERNKSDVEKALELELAGHKSKFAAELQANLNPAATQGPDAGKTGGSTPPAVAAAMAAGKVGAMESRFLGGGRTTDHQKETAQYSKKAVKIQERMLAALENPNIDPALAGQISNRLAVVTNFT